MSEEMLEKLCEAYWNAGATVKTTWAGADEEQRRVTKARMRAALEYMEMEGYSFVNVVEDGEV